MCSSDLAIEVVTELNVIVIDVNLVDLKEGIPQLEDLKRQNLKKQNLEVSNPILAKRVGPEDSKNNFTKEGGAKYSSSFFLPINFDYLTKTQNRKLKYLVKYFTYICISYNMHY